MIDSQTVEIEPVISHSPFVLRTTVPHPLRDQEKITIGEDIVFQLKISLPTSTNPGFTIVIYGNGLEGVAGNVVSVGDNVKSLGGNIEVTGEDLLVCCMSNIYSVNDKILTSERTSQFL